MKKRTFLKNWILLLAVAAATASPAAARIIYVDDDAPGSNNGSSWNDAYNDLQDALADARSSGPSVTAIWVAAGTYKPTENESDLNATFELVEGIATYGGFAGTETSLSQRNLADPLNKTTLTGDLDNNPSTQGCANTITCDNLSEATLDGFTITEGWTSGISCNSSDIAISNCKVVVNTDGIYIYNSAAPQISNCTFENNYGYSVKCYNCRPTINNSNLDGKNRAYKGLYCTTADVLMNNCTVKNHISDGISADNSDLIVNQCITEHNNGKGIRLSSCSMPEITGSTIRFNDSYGIYCLNSSDVNIVDCNIAGNEDDGIYSINTDITVSNCIISQNEDEGIICNDAATSVINIRNNWIYDNGTGTGDYAIYLSGSGDLEDVTICNNTIVGNTGYGIGTSGYPDTITNCIICGNNKSLQHDNYNVTYSCIQGGCEGQGNIDAEPCFCDPNANNYHLDVNSPCINTGDPGFSPVSNETDIDGEPRIAAGRVDMGADEYHQRSPADFDGNRIVNFIDYAALAGAWQSNNSELSLDSDDDVDFDDLALFCEDWLWVPEQ